PPRHPLPFFNLPKDVPDALREIKKIGDEMARSVNENMYLYGVYFAFVRKEMKPKGQWMCWCAENVKKFTYRTIDRIIEHAEQCERYGHLIPYNPSHSREPFDMLSSVDKASPIDLTDGELEAPSPALDSMLEKKKDDPGFQWTEHWAVQKVYLTFLKCTSVRWCSIEEKQMVADKAIKEIQEYMKGEQEARIEFAKMPLSYTQVDLSYLEQLKDEVLRKERFEVLRKAMELLDVGCEPWDDDREPWVSNWEPGEE